MTEAATALPDYKFILEERLVDVRYSDVVDPPAPLPASRINVEHPKTVDEANEERTTKVGSINGKSIHHSTLIGDAKRSCLADIQRHCHIGHVEKRERQTASIVAFDNNERPEKAALISRKAGLSPNHSVEIKRHWASEFMQH